MGYFQEALKSLRPDKEFSTFEDDTVIVWHDEDVVSPTQEEIEAEIARLNAIDENLVESKLQVKESAATKLAALGLTQDEIKAITA
jgi:predicted enzyme involved in methoxymalonyl-ACP biosynthesis